MKGLDRYLTNPPEDGFDSYCESVIEAVSDEFYERNQDWIVSDYKWFEKLFHKGIESELAAKIIERAFKIYKL